MNKRFFMRGLLFAALSLAAGFAACSDDRTEGTVTLHYPEISDIGPSMPGLVPAPSYKGAKPSQFAIERISFGQEAFTDQSESFVIDASTGSITITNTDHLATGTYGITVSCLAGGARNFFPDAVKIHMLPATPENIRVMPEVLEIPYEGAKSSKLSAEVVSEDETVTISQYALIQEEGREYFTVSDKGVITVNPKFEGEILPGVYTPGLRLTSKAGSALYEQCVTLKITSKPLDVVYKPLEGRSEFDRAFASPVPVLKGSLDELKYAIASVVPETDKFAIDPSTGVISLAEGNGLEVGGEYIFTLAVSNKYGSSELGGVYSVRIVAFITPIDPATFSYPASEAVEACAFAVDKTAGFVGDEVSFAFGEAMPEALAGQLAIDEQTGRISARKGNSIPVGVYEVPVVVSNIKGEAAATLKLTVSENPNMFHKFGYGNNLGLDKESNFDQFRWNGDGKTNTAYVIPLADGYNDFAGRKPAFKLDVIHNWAIQDSGDATKNYVDENGDLHVFMRANRWGQIGYVRVTATLGEGETAVSRSTVVFLMLRNPKNSDQIEYTPFVHRINSRNGGFTGIKPTFGADVDRSKVMMSFRQNGFLYENLTDEKPAGGKLDKSNTTFTIYKLWGIYEGKPATNAASRLPFCFYDGDGNKDTNDKMTRKLGYFDPENDFQIYITPSIWFNEGAPVNGIFTFQASYSVTANNEDLGKTANLIGCAVWLDENF